MALTVVERPEPLRPEQADDLARADVERDAMQDMALAVVGVEVVELAASSVSSRACCVGDRTEPR